MSKIDLKSREWCELVFEGRNKEYGAYDLRAKSGQRQVKGIIAILILIAAIAVLVGIKMAADSIMANSRDRDAELATELSQLKKDEPVQKKEEIKQEYEQPEVQKVAVKASIQFTVPEIVDVVDESKKMKNQEELNRSNISIASQDYEGDVNGKGTIDDLKDNQQAGGNQAAPEEDCKIYTIVETPASFPGGEAALLNYVNSHLKYPAIAQEEGIQGKVVLKFVVLENGNVGQVQVVQSLESHCDQEAVRVVKSLPRFSPGKQQGKPVKSWFTLPIRFQLM